MVNYFQETLPFKKISDNFNYAREPADLNMLIDTHSSCKQVENLNTSMRLSHKLFRDDFVVCCQATSVLSTVAKIVRSFSYRFCLEIQRKLNTQPPRTQPLAWRMEKTISFQKLKSASKDVKIIVFFHDFKSAV